MANAWFKYSGSGWLSDPIYYNKVSAQPSCPSPNVEICAIFADTQFISGVPRPIITPGLQEELNTAVLSHTESANVTL